MGQGKLQQSGFAHPPHRPWHWDFEIVSQILLSLVRLLKLYQNFILKEQFNSSKHFSTKLGSWLNIILHSETQMKNIM